MPLESPESSSPIVTRAVAAALSGEYSEAFQISTVQRLFLRLLSYLPSRTGRFVLSRFNSLTGIDAELVKNLRLDDLIRQRLKDYGKLSGPFPAITTGAAMGGASANLSVALGAPFLPQAFVLTLKKGSRKGDVEEYALRYKELALRLAASHPQAITVQHFDPIHDEWVVRYASHLRMKLTGLPPAYKEFIRRYLQPGGSICLLDSRAKWLRYRLGERSFLQVGGWGDIPPEEFLTGSPRVEAFCRQVGYDHSSWALDGYSLEEGPESEWGCEPGLADDIEDFCRQEGYRFVPITLPDPFDYSRLAFQATRLQQEAAGQAPSGVVIESFGQFDASAVRKAGLLPVWLIFNTEDNLRYLKQIRPEFPSGKPVFFSPLVTFSITPDCVPWSSWEEALQGTNWVNIGARSSHYPADVLPLLGWAGPLRKWVEKNQREPAAAISADWLAEAAQELQRTRAEA